MRFTIRKRHGKWQCRAVTDTALQGIDWNTHFDSWADAVAYVCGVLSMRWTRPLLTPVSAAHDFAWTCPSCTRVPIHTAAEHEAMRP